VKATNKPISNAILRTKGSVSLFHQ
jgi:hypothetical protein